MWAVAALVLGAAVVAVALWGMRAGGPAGHAGPPNILLVTLDTTRADHIGAYGHAGARTPTLDGLARAGVLFERAVTAAPTTLPAHVSLMTGRNPMAHGVQNNGLRFGDALPTLATALRAAGYRTGAFVSAFVLDARFGLARGFDVYDDTLDPPSGRATEEVERRGDRTVTAAEAWLAGVSPAPGAAASASGAAAERPFFLWLHLYDPHDPYDPPAAFRDAPAQSPYDGEIAFADAALATLLGGLERRGLTANTIVAVVGDHGESLGEHGEATHGMFVYEAAMRIPALLAWPARLPAGLRVTSLVRAIDLAPTLLELAGRAPLDGATGVSLLPLVHGRGPGPAVAYGETYFPRLFMNWAPLRSLRDGQWKFIEAPELELYDLAADPGEITNLAARDPDRAGRMRRALHALLAAETSAQAAAGADRETMRKLAALGYVGGGSSGADADPLARPDPKAMIEVFNRLRGANAALDAGNLDEASRVARDTLVQDPGNAFAMLILGKAARARGQYREAATQFRAYLHQVPLSADAHHWLAICQLQLGDFDGALAEVEAALAIDPRFAEALTLRGDLLAAAGRIDEGLHDLRAAVNVNPDRPAAHIALGRTLTRVGEPGAAAERFAYALELAHRLEGAGRGPQAALVYEQLALEPSVPAAIQAAARARLAAAAR